MVMLTGIGVDLMRFERDRVHTQNTLDSAVLAAAGLRQTQKPVAVVESYFEKAGVNPELVEVDADSVRLAGNGELLSREVRGDTQVGLSNVGLTALLRGSLFLAALEILKLYG